MMCFLGFACFILSAKFLGDKQDYYSKHSYYRSHPESNEDQWKVYYAAKDILSVWQFWSLWMVPFLLVILIGRIYFRGQIRRMFNIPGHCFEDCMEVVLCGPCVVAQEAYQADAAQELGLPMVHKKAPKRCP